jgi:hypothetical protein
VLWLELSPDKAAGMRTIFTMLGFLMLATTPLVLLIPDAARERRLAATRSSAPTGPSAAPTPAATTVAGVSVPGATMSRGTRT